MNFLDWFLILLVLAYALSGYWQGFITGAFATAGLLLGGYLGIRLAPTLLGEIAGSRWVSLAALFVVLVCATFGQAVLQYGGARLRERVKWQPARALDAVGGATLSVVAVLVVSWALGVAVSGAQLPWVSTQVRESAVLKRVDDVMPARAVTALDSFNDVVSSSFFPRYLEPFARERIVEVEPPPSGILADADVEAAEASVLKIRGENSCNRGVEGSGFLYSPDRLMTNAHVVAGVDDPVVIVGDQEVAATVVHYDEDLDVAVLAVDGLNRPFLEFDANGRDGQAAAVLGYPEDGPYNAEPARIRSQQRLRSSDIYNEGSVVREVFSIRSEVRAGNSGGPLVGAEGQVLGVIFAASITDTETGYALTTAQVRSSAAQGVTSDREVDTGRCA